MNIRKSRVWPLIAISLGMACGLEAIQNDKGSSTEVVLIGTLHQFHQQNPRYSLESLRALIVAVKPAAILIELPPTIGGQPTVEKERAAGRFANDENGAANAAAEELKIPVIPYDRDGRNEIYVNTKYFDRQSRLSRRVQEWLNTPENRNQAPVEAALLGPIYRDSARSRDYFMLNAGPEIVNSEGFDRVLRLKHFVWEELMPELSASVASLRDVAPEFAFFRDEWHERNQIMADNILVQAKKRPGKRIVVLCGGEHRYILRDLLSGKQGIVLKEFYETPR